VLGAGLGFVHDRTGADESGFVSQNGSSALIVSEVSG
jgi:hypothetical protein